MLLTFNYRYSPRNSALRQVIQDGLIGEVTSIDFQWMLDTKHGADYFRRWHREKKNSGGLLVHKASHHFDLVNWWIHSTPRRVYASGGLRFYGAENAAVRGLGERPERGTRDGAHDGFDLDLRENANLKALYLDAEGHDGYVRDRDVFGEGITIEDNLALVVDYANGATLSYSLNAHAPWEGYRVAVNGTLGRVELDVVERGAVLESEGLHPGARPERGRCRHLRDRCDPRASACCCSGTGRSRSRSRSSAETAATAAATRSCSPTSSSAPAKTRSRVPANWRDGVQSIAVGIAGNRSLATGMPVEVADLGIRLLAQPVR